MIKELFNIGLRTARKRVLKYGCVSPFVIALIEGEESFLDTRKVGDEGVAVFEQQVPAFVAENNVEALFACIQSDQDRSSSGFTVFLECSSYSKIGFQEYSKIDGNVAFDAMKMQNSPKYFFLNFEN